MFGPVFKNLGAAFIISSEAEEHVTIWGGRNKMGNLGLDRFFNFQVAMNAQTSSSHEGYT